jgi:hypothetical protein
MTKSRTDKIKFAVSVVTAVIAGTIIGILIMSYPIILSWGVFFLAGKWSR